MLSDDVFKTRLRVAIGELEVWLATLAPLARVDLDQDEASWRATLVPNAPEACPFELVLRIDQQFDMAVGPETYEDQPIAELAAFQPLLQAIASGRVVTSAWTTAATGTRIRVRTEIAPIDRPLWARSRELLPAAALREPELIRHDRHYAPYARGA
jgi:hypothetical protein